MGWSGDTGKSAILGGGRLSEGQARPAHTRLAGTVVGGKYTLGRLFYSDRAGSLYEAKATEAEGKKKLAVYVVSPAAKVDPDVKLVGGHPNFVRLRGMVQEGGRTTLVVLDPPMGQSLHSVLVKRGTLQPGAIVSVAVQVLSALHSLHVENRMSGTLSSECIFLDRGKDNILRVTVVDVGYKTAVDLPEDVSYLAPEEIDRAPGIDVRSDIWTVGVLLYEMIYGHRPFRGATRYEIMGWIVLNDPEYPQPPGRVPPGLLDIIRKALTKGPENRYQSVTNMIGDLLPLQEDLENTLNDDVAQALRETVLPQGAVDAPPAAAAPASLSAPGETAALPAERTAEATPSEGPRTAWRIMPYRPYSPAVVKATLVAGISRCPGAPAPAVEDSVKKEPADGDTPRPSLPLADVLFSHLPEPVAPESLRISSMAWPVAPLDPQPIPHPKVQWIKPTKEHDAPLRPEASSEPAGHPTKKKKKRRSLAEHAGRARISPVRIGIATALVIAGLCGVGYLAMELVKGRAKPVRPVVVDSEAKSMSASGVASTGKAAADAKAAAEAEAAKQERKQRKPMAQTPRTTYDQEANRPQPKSGPGTKQKKKKIGGLADNPW
ncbi:MAG: protein kinase [Deltaproteobacteria bacterium]|nr:protein kinase [Deltaproteobacteria bacterium]